MALLAVSATTFTGRTDDISGINDLSSRLKHDKGLDRALHVDAASGRLRVAVVYPTPSGTSGSSRCARWDDLSGHKFGFVYRGSAG